MSELSVFQSYLSAKVKAPVTADEVGTSKADPSAGGGGDSAAQKAVDPNANDPITTADKAGAGILTALVLSSLAGCTWWICFI